LLASLHKYMRAEMPKAYVHKSSPKISQLAVTAQAWFTAPRC